MALADAVKGATYTQQTITWTNVDGLAQNLTGATLSGTIKDVSTGVVRAITGTLTLVTPASGIFLWDYSTADVATAGVFEVQFKATYAGSEYDATIKTGWKVHELQTVV